MRSLAFPRILPPSPLADGMLIYKLLGDDAQQSFTRSWGVSYGVGAASEWQARSARAASSPRTLVPVHVRIRS
jgi:hypothetical protein